MHFSMIWLNNLCRAHEFNSKSIEMEIFADFFFVYFLQAKVFFFPIQFLGLLMFASVEKENSENCSSEFSNAFCLKGGTKRKLANVQNIFKHESNLWLTLFYKKLFIIWHMACHSTAKERESEWVRKNNVFRLCQQQWLFIYVRCCYNFYLRLKINEKRGRHFKNCSSQRKMRDFQLKLVMNNMKSI